MHALGNQMTLPLETPQGNGGPVGNGVTGRSKETRLKQILSTMKPSCTMESRPTSPGVIQSKSGLGIMLIEKMSGIAKATKTKLQREIKQSMFV